MPCYLCKLSILYCRIVCRNVCSLYATVSPSFKKFPLDNAKNKYGESNLNNFKVLSSECRFQYFTVSIILQEVNC